MTINQKIYVSAIVVILLAAAIGSFLIYPAFSAIQKSSFELLQDKEKIALFHREAEAREKTEQLFRKYQQDFATMEKLFVDPDVPLELIGFLENTASNSNLQLVISSITKGVKGKKDPWPTLVLQLSITGSPANFLEFLEKLESTSYLLEVQELNLRDTLATLIIKVYTR